MLVDIKSANMMLFMERLYKLQRFFRCLVRERCVSAVITAEIECGSSFAMPAARGSLITAACGGV